MKIKTISSGSAIVATAAAVAAATAAILAGAPWWLTAVIVVVLFGVGYFASLVVMQQFVIYRLKPLYQILFSRNVRTSELEEEYESAADMVNNIGGKLTNWAETNRLEIERLRENEQYRKDYIGNVSHELKTPIFNVQGYISTLLDGGASDEAVARDYLERAEKNIDRLINIVTDLDEISKLESGVLKLQPERFDIVALARECAEGAELEAARKGITITVGNPAPPQPPIYVTADRHYIMQVLSNLIVNSIRYGYEEGRTHIEFIDLFDKVMVEVADNGIGMEKKEIPRVFERFYRTDYGRSREQGGTGLGLSIVKHVIEAHGETIKVRSEPGEGSTFSFPLPKA
ncbi:sensor histidine kinase [Alistipes sp. OttesenSCG-928-B03]|nr:sensor histidine kinase [Alistipes sp. OttesenSCG-928-B03]